MPKAAAVRWWDVLTERESQLLEHTAPFSIIIIMAALGPRRQVSAIPRRTRAQIVHSQHWPRPDISIGGRRHRRHHLPFDGSERDASGAHANT